MQEIPETYIEHEQPVTLPGVASRVPAVIPHVVIVGAGFGGLQAARALQDAPVRVTVIVLLVLASFTEYVAESNWIVLV